MFWSEKSIIIDRPVDAVWVFVSCVENVFMWDPEFLDVKRMSDGPTDVGSMVQYQRVFLGRKCAGTLRVSECEVNKVLTVLVDEPGIAGKIRYQFEAVGSGTRLTGTSEGEVSGWYRLLTPLLVFLLDKGGKDDLANVKRFVEAES